MGHHLNVGRAIRMSERLETVDKAALRISGNWRYVGERTLVFEVPRPLRHDAVVMAATAALRLDRIGKHEQGFVTSGGRFVGRREAAEIAFATGQVDRQLPILATEDLW